MTMSPLHATLALASALILAGCAPVDDTPAPVSSNTSTETDADASAYGGFAIDPPADDEIVLTIEAAADRDFTYSELQQLATVEISILEPFVNQRQSFSGVPLADLLGLAGITASDRIETIALNDYRFADSASQWADADALLAVYRDGALIPMDQGGPIRIVFAEDSAAYGQLDAWNWSLRTIAVVE
ncbi:molybdopterin-dependent oxidoreductase [Microcella sp.]|uniref:molybdopterin-dependent oxidoreductase n=1 Tax=Microcella sp. TaxID=1913979 RepID=UPI0025633D4F|nr:molybdopterin-dependent oxidoreductase [Microcella sp.]MBX9472894.1 molybdopterin-dependent oxidoreductase [Microcella sp.]